MTTIDVETTEPSDLPAPPGPLNQTITADQTVGPTALADFVRQAMAELPAIAGADRATAHRYFDDFALRRLPAALATARQDTVTAARAPLAEMFADAGGMVQLSREQARGRAGDFEIIEYILRGQPEACPAPRATTSTTTSGAFPSPTSTAIRLPTRPHSSSPNSGATRRTSRARPPARHRPPHPADSVRRRHRPAPSRPGSPAPRRPPGPQRRRPRRPHTPAARDSRPDRCGPRQRPAHRRPPGRREPSPDWTSPPMPLA